MVGFLPEDSAQQLLSFAPKCDIKLLDGVCAMRQRVALNARVLRAARHVVSCRRRPGGSVWCMSIVNCPKWLLGSGAGPQMRCSLAPPSRTASSQPAFGAMCLGCVMARAFPPGVGSREPH